MRGVKLAQVAAQAEILRLKRFGGRQAGRAVMGAIALVFVLAFLACLHVAGYFALRRADILPVWAALIVAGVDLLIALIFGLIARISRPGRVEREALEVRLLAQQHLVEAAAVTAVVGPALRALGMRRIYGLALAAMTARYLSGRR